MQRSLLPWILILGGLVACRPPVPVDGAPDPALEAAAQAAAAPFPAAQRAEFVRGFRMGARMIREATRRHRTPWRPVLGQPAPPPLPAAARAAGAQTLPPGFDVEVDPATGFPWSPLDPGQGGFNPGEVAGFAWALAPVRDQLAHPVPPPAFPAPGSWVPWHPPGVHLWDPATPDLQVQATWIGNALAWSWVDRGFPPIRGWREVPDGFAPVALALRDRRLWIAAKGRGSFALDLASGFIVGTDLREPGPADLQDPALDEQTWRARVAQQEAEDRRHRPAWLARAAQGDAHAMISLAFSSEAPEEAAAWFRKAAEAGDPEGMYEYAIRLYQGRGVPQDRTAARQWFERAAQAGHPQANDVLRGLFQ